MNLELHEPIPQIGTNFAFDTRTNPSFIFPENLMNV